MASAACPGPARTATAESEGTHASSAADPAGGSTEHAVNIGDRITELKARAAAMRSERAAVTKALRNAEKRRTRLKRRARLLTADDLVAVIQLRAEDRAAK